MITEMLDVADIPCMEHDEGMAVAAAEYDRVLEVVDRFTPDDWAEPTECPGWDVRDMVTHLLGFMKANADHAEAARQLEVAAREAEERGVLRLDAREEADDLVAGAHPGRGEPLRRKATAVDVGQRGGAHGGILAVTTDTADGPPRLP